jgi:hypothetical protein
MRYYQNMNIRKTCIILATLVVSGLGIAVVSSSVQMAQAAKTNQCGISGTVHSEQQQLGVKSGNFGKAVGGFNGNAVQSGGTHSGGFQGSTDRTTPSLAKDCSDK